MFENYAKIIFKLYVDIWLDRSYMRVVLQIYTGELHE